MDTSVRLVKGIQVSRHIWIRAVGVPSTIKPTARLHPCLRRSKSSRDLLPSQAHNASDRGLEALGQLSCKGGDSSEGGDPASHTSLPLHNPHHFVEARYSSPDLSARDRHL